jgi:hypothetical protein
MGGIIDMNKSRDRNMTFMDRLRRRKLMAALGMTVILALAPVIAWVLTPEDSRTVFAEGTTEGVLTYTLSGTSVTVTDCNTAATNTDVAAAFSEIATVSSLSITAIGNNAFQGCATLTFVDIPDTVTSIGSNAFANTGLKSVSLPQVLTTVGSGVFSGTQISSISIPVSVSSFNVSGAFSGMSNLTDVTFKAGRESIPSNAIRDAAYVNSVTIEKPELIKSIGNQAFDGCKALTAFTIPENVTSIGSYAFANTGLTSVTLTQSLTTLGSGVFSGTQISSISIPATVSSFNVAAFSGMSSLTAVTFKAGRESIPSNAIRDAAYVNSVTIEKPELIKSIGNQAFDGCKALTAFAIPENVTDIGSYAFANTGLTSVTLPQVLTTLGGSVFSGTQISSISIPATVSSFNVSGAFSGMNQLTTVTFEAGRDSIPNYALCDAAYVTKALIPKTVTSIPGEYTFTDCDNVVLYGYHETYAIEYARANERAYEELPVITTDSLPEAYRYIPYYAQIESSDPGGGSLFFQLSGGVLPLGLNLSASGEITGAPLEYGRFDVQISLIDTAIDGSDLWPDTVDLTLYVAPRPSDALLLSTVNDYFILDNIGEADPISGRYVIERYRDEYGNVIFRVDAGFPFFLSLWIEGIEQRLFIDYNAEDGSTRITILAQTIQRLDSGEYTAAAEFIENGEHKVAAQNFTVVWKIRDNPGGGGSSGGSGDGNVDGGNGNNGATPGLTPTSDPQPTAAPSASAPQPTAAPTAAAPQPTSAPTAPDDPQPTAAPAPGQTAVPDNGAGGGGTEISTGIGENSGFGDSGVNTNNGFVAGDGIVSDTSAAINTDATDARTPISPNEPPGAASGAADAVSVIPDPAASGPVPGETDGGAETEAETELYTIHYDGTGPFEVRIDILLEEFREMRFDGALWTSGADYEVRSGSTVLTIPESRLEKVAEGRHVISAVFENQTVEIAFTLNKTSVGSNGLNENEAEAAFPVSESGPITNGGTKNNAPLIPIIGAILSVSGAAVFGTRVFKRKKAA